MVTPADEAGEGESSAPPSRIGGQGETDWTSGSFVPLTYRRVTEQEAIQQAVSGQQQPSTVSWARVGECPLNEFHSEGYITRAFPTLFPTGAAIGYYLKHLMLYQDGRFVKHPRFRSFALNTEMR